jgi:diphthamide synthase subunit DPH2
VETRSAATIARLRLANARQLRRRQQVEAIFRRGGLRPILELLEELIRHGLVAEAELDCRLAVYGRLNPEALKITGGDRLPPLPIRAFGGR